MFPASLFILLFYLKYFDPIFPPNLVSWSGKPLEMLRTTLKIQNNTYESI